MRSCPAFIRHAALAILLVLGPASAASLNDLIWLTEDFRPYNYQAGGEARGLMVEVLLAAGRAVDDPVDRARVQVLPWSRALRMAAARPDSVLFGLARTAEREDDYQWAGPVLPVRIVLLGPPEAAALDPEDWRIGVVRDDVAERLVIEAGYHPDQQVVTAFPESTARMLHAGRVDVWAYGELPAQRHLEALDGGAAWQVHEVLSATDAHFGFHPEVSPELVARFRAGLASLQRPDADGETGIDRLIQEYARSGY